MAHLKQEEQETGKNAMNDNSQTRRCISHRHESKEEGKKDHVHLGHEHVHGFHKVIHEGKTKSTSFSHRLSLFSFLTCLFSTCFGIAFLVLLVCFLFLWFHFFLS